MQVYICIYIYIDLFGVPVVFKTSGAAVWEASSIFALKGNWPPKLLPKCILL